MMDGVDQPQDHQSTLAFGKQRYLWRFIRTIISSVTVSAGKPMERTDIHAACGGRSLSPQGTVKRTPPSKE